MLSEWTFQCSRIQQLPKEHSFKMMSSDFVAKFVQDQTQLVNVLALVDLYVDMLRWSCTLYEVSFNFRCHVSLSSCNRREFELAFLDAPE